MSIELLMVNLIIILFPIFTNVMYELYIKNSGKKENDLLLDITLISSLYLLISLSNSLYLALLNIIFLLALVKKRIFTSIIISISIILVYELNGISYFIILLIQILFYLLSILYYKFKKRKLFINLFILVEVVFICVSNVIAGFNTLNIINSIVVSIVFSLVAYLVIYILKVSEDITRLHMTIKEFEKEKQIRDSLFKITHEIKNPIAVCKSYLDMFDFDNPEHEKYIPILKEEINNILVLLQDFACMSKIKIQKEILDINLLLEDISRQFKPILVDDNINFITDISEDELYIEGDYNRLSQVLVNIIKNSKEAKDKTKKSFISLKTNIKEKSFIITVEDNGIGISKHDMKKIKEPFYTTKKNGTGLGVSLSLEIIKSHGGKIEFTSDEGVGTKVVITLPLRRIKF